ncbi:hypothetical protein LSTR_LSTR013062 [Laodelphax striatellus]|uniref:BEACH domain-containing protein n=1 Tax=Laodelphax striatellus TaxID=195883 RepID=A0A482WR37_LAOST|nr:hypothetical protein LSTR_LSTR013062 [Laodelphax striatellus]
MDASCVINQELQIPFEYMTAHSRPERVKCIVHISWLRSILTTGELSQFVEHDKLSSAEVSAWLKQGENFGPLWQKILITVIDKPNKTVIPLPRPRTGARPDIQLTFSQTCSYVAQTNYKNIWKEAYKKYSNTSFNGKMSERQCKINLMDCGEVLREVVGRAYGCPIINLNGGAAPEQLELSNQFEAHHNLLPAAIALETDHCFLILQEYEYEHSLLDCVRFSPALLSGNYAKPLFIIYQLLRLMRQLHDNGLVLGDITLSDILVSDNLWIQVLPRLEANIYTVPDVSCNKHEDQLIQQTTPDEPCSAASQLTAVESQTLSQSADNNQLMRDRERELGRLCEAWVRGALSNFDYLTALNRLAGRRYGDPRSHHVFPWVTDFSSRSGCSWRDLTRSKFRLNKGDRQLDLTYDLPPGAGLNQVPHHVSDVLSEITYYVYLCRVTPRAVLQKYVRPQWVPAEYPSSIQRLQEWTPDECIPEFFTDPTVFKSIHADLADLEVPSWAESAEDLVSAHRAILESAHVSDRLHHWIDLTFGYKLSGAAAVKSKNVCLQLVDGHTRLTDVGVVQLFTQPHPPHVSPNPYLSKTPPVFGHRDRKRGTCDEEDGGHSSGVEDEDVQITRSSPSGLSRILSRSRTSLHTTSGAPSTSTPLSPSSEQQQQQQQQDKSPPASIVLPRDYKPVAALVACEALHNFLNRTCQLMPPESAADGRLAAPHDSCSYKQVVAARRVQEMVVLGCLIVELFAPSKLHVFGCALQQQQQQHPSPTHPPHPSTALQRRADICRRLSLAAATAQLLPRCVRQLVQQLLGGSGEPVTPLGTPPPSAHQLLQPSLSSCVLPFPDNYAQVYNMFRCLQEYDSALLDLKRVMIKDSLDGVNRTEGLSLLAERINELKVKSLVEDIENLVERASASLVSTPAWLPLLLPHILPLLSSNETRVTAAWYLFDPIAR